MKDLSLAQCALIAGLPNSPNYYSPFHSVEAAKQRQSIVLDQMVKYGYITESEAAAAKKRISIWPGPRNSGEQIVWRLIL